MGRWFKRLLDLLGVPGDIETIGKWITTLLGVSAMSGGLVGYAQGLGWAIFVFMGIFAFGIVAFGRLQEMRDANKLEYKLIPREIEPLNIIRARETSGANLTFASHSLRTHHANVKFKKLH